MVTFKNKDGPLNIYANCFPVAHTHRAPWRPAWNKREPLKTGYPKQDYTKVSSLGKGRGLFFNSTTQKSRMATQEVSSGRHCFCEG